jgi:phosphatidylinositol alpha 1,6-mannosyltransferase
MRAGRDQSRAQLGLGPGEIAVLYVGRLVPQKGIETLVEAVAEAPARLVLVGDGPLLEPLRRLAPDAIFAGFLEGDELVEAYVAADVFALLSTREPWGVVVNEAAAAGLPLVLSETVGAAADLLRPGENGLAVPAGDSSAAAAALRTLAGDAELRRRYGARSRELALAWGYEPSVDAFELAVREAVERR